MISVKTGEGGRVTRGGPLNDGWRGRFNEGVDNMQGNMSM